MKVNTIQNMHIIVATILVFLHISFNCLHGPNKKKVDASDTILPNVYTIANL